MARQLLLSRRRPAASRSAKPSEKRGTTFWSRMLRVVKRAVLNQCWFHVSSPTVRVGVEPKRSLISEQFVSRRAMYAFSSATKSMLETAVSRDKFTSNLSSSLL